MALKTDITWYNDGINFLHSEFSQFWKLFISNCVFLTKVTCAISIYRRKIYRIDQNLTILNLNCFHIINQIPVISWYRCESDIAIFAWRVTWNYVYSPCFVDSFDQAKKGSVLRMYTVHCTGKGRECKNFSSFMLHCIVSTFHIGFPMRGFYLRAIASPCAQLTSEFNCAQFRNNSVIIQ